jgi:hypothetical protein
MREMKVLAIQVDVTDLTEEQVSDLKFAMEVQTEDYELVHRVDSNTVVGSIILNSGVRTIQLDEEKGEELEAN